MGLQHAFDDLSQVVEQFEQRGRPVRDIETTTHPDSAGALAVSMTVPFSLCAESGAGLDSPLTPERAALSESGELTVSLSVSDLLPELSRAEPVADVDDRTVHVEDGKLNVTVDFCIDPGTSTGTATESDDVAREETQAGDATDGETTVASNGNEDTLAARLLATPSDDVPPDDMTSKGEQSHDGTDEADETAEADDGSDGETLADCLARTRSEDVPPYDDTDYLRALYESCGTFTEMSDRIEMDVAAETVRRYMIEADIHDPNSYDTAAHDAAYDSDDEPVDPVTDESETAIDSVASELPPSATDDIPEEQFVTDGIGLPDGVTLEDIVDAVASSPTVYSVQRSLGLDYGPTRDLLKQLNVIDMVLHRVDDPPDEISKNDVVQRIRQCDTETA